MATELDLKQVERKMYLSYQEDGLIDIALGIVVLGFGLTMLVGSFLLLILAWISVALVWPAKRLLTYPRLGHVRFTPERRRKLSAGVLGLFLLGIVALLLVVTVSVVPRETSLSSGPWYLNPQGLLLGLLMAMLPILIAVFFRVRRFFVYALVVFLPWLASFSIPLQPELPVVLAAGIILLSGIGLLTRFLRQFPSLAEDADDTRA